MAERLWGKTGIMDGKWRVTDTKEKMERTDLERLAKGERDGLCIFWESHRRRAWLVRDDFIDSAQSPALLFMEEESEAIMDLESWPDATFEFWKRVLDEDVVSLGEA